MSETTKAQSRALARVCRMLLAAKRHGQTTIDVGEVEAALDEVDVQGLANPRPCSPVCNIGHAPGLGSVGCG